MLNQAEEILCFAAIIEHGSITKSAKHLNRSKAHISRKLTELEARYKVKLFHRSTRSMRLTDAGEKLHPHALDIYHKQQKLGQIAKHLQMDLTGNFGISVSDSSAHFLLAPLLPKLFEHFPDIQFNIHVSNSPIDLIGKNIDLSIRSGHVRDENLVAQELGIVKEKIYAASNNTINAHEIRTPHQLNNYKLITNDYSLHEGKTRLQNADQTVIVEPQNITLVNRYKIILDLLKDSNSIAILPEYAAKKALETGEIINILPNWQNAQWPIYLLHPYQIPAPIKLKAISQFIAKNLTIL